MKHNNNIYIPISKVSYEFNGLMLSNLKIYLGTYDRK